MRVTITLTIAALALAGLSWSNADWSLHAYERCQEDQLCWQPLLDGNHQGEMNGGMPR